MTKTARAILQQLFNAQIANFATVLRPPTITKYRRAAKYFLSYLQASHPQVRRPSQLRRDPHILGWLRSLYQRQPPLANKTRMELIIQVRRLLNDLAFSNDPPREDLFVRGDCPPHDKYLPKPLSPEDDRLLQQQLRRKQTLRSYALLLMRATGMRIGECLNLQVDSLRELDRNQWAIRVPLGKLHTERWIPIDHEGREIFRTLLRLRHSQPATHTKSSSTFLLLQKNGRPPSYVAMRDELINAALQAGCSVRPTPHQLRHTYATAMLRAGASLPAVKELLGHRSLEMTMRYVQVSQIDLQREYHQARQRMGQLHTIPRITKKPATLDMSLLRHSVSDAAHLIEMFRRQQTDDRAKRKLARLTNRLTKISTELNLLDKDEK